MRVRALTMEGVSRRFGAHLAVRRVSLTLRAGEVTLLLGPNGAGKTTVMTLLSGLLPPTQGHLQATVELPGGAAALAWEEVLEASPETIGLVSHASLLYEDLTGRENLALFGGLYGLSGEALEARVGALLERVELVDAADRRVNTYSRGMRQRLSIARAILQSPSVLLLDEPYTGLDSAGMRLLSGLLAELRDAGALLVLVTHQLDFPPGLIDRAVVLQSGRVVADGAPGDGVAAWYEGQLRAAEAQP